MKKEKFKRLGLCLLQYLLAVGTMLAAAGLLLNSYVLVNSIDGTQIYKLFPADMGVAFEDSEIYHDLFRNSVSDITQLVAIKRQLETDGIFDPLKEIDITASAREIGVDEGCGISAVYELNDLIKWGKSGVEYTNRFLGMSDFVNYFGNCVYPENFKLDEYGQLCFDGFYRVDDFSEEGTGQDDGGSQESTTGQESGTAQGGVPGQESGTAQGGVPGQESGTAQGGVPGQESGMAQGGVPGQDGSDGKNGNVTQEGDTVSPSGKTEEEIEQLAAKLSEYTEEQLEDLVLSYIMAQKLKNVDVSREDDSRIVVYVPMLNCRYDTMDGKRQLTGCANNWIDYMLLQENTVAVIENIASNYQRYQICNDAYKEEHTNVKYMVRMMTDNGMCTYTNCPDLGEAEDDYVTEAFSEYRWYLIYYPDSLVFMGNTILSEEEIDGYISSYAYAYPDTTHIWMGVDASYAVEGDAFQATNAVYQKIVPNINRILGGIFLMAAAWLGIGIYLTLKTGMTVAGDGGQVWHLSRFDRIWTEFFLLLTALFIYGGVYGYRVLRGIVESAGTVSNLAGIQLTRLYQYGLFALYGLYVSVAFHIVWYSLVRRVKADNLWRESFLHHFCKALENSARFILRHKNSVVSVLLPYHLFLFFNLTGIVLAYVFREEQLYLSFILAALVAVDGLVGVFLFRHNAEQTEIVEGINRIRDGEVDFKLDTDTLHGSSAEMADAVNNIGEGIKKAVSTSLKDEQLKTDLITNVSHDIKTPLTSIINYVDLLKRLHMEEEPARGYIEILDGKAQRLKQLTDDLVEASKISSGNIELEREKLNLTELLNQAIGEFSEKLRECRLQVVFEKEGTPAYIYADSRRMWRVMENLFNNICKYALEGTRIYIDMARREDRIEVSLKNISRQQMNIRSEELTERFIRGDSSRTTEGSGLGLYIARSLVQVQGGSFEIYLDGDLFKTVLSFPEYQIAEVGETGER